MTAGAGARPTFLVIGAQKAATTTLYRFLLAHPDVFVPPEVKETNFLLDSEDGGAWGRGLAWYESLYAAGRGHAHRGDVSPAYTIFPLFRHAPARAAELMPDARLVYLVRHPVERMVSAWAQLVGGGHEHRSLPDALLHEAHYAQASCYGMQLEQWLAHFDRERLLVLRAEDLAADPGATLDRFLVHLGLPPGWRPEDPSRSWNRSDRKATVPPTLQRAAGALRALGAERLAVQLGPGGRIGRRARRPIPGADRRLDPELAADLEQLFVADAAQLRAIVGPDMDLWGLA